MLSNILEAITHKKIWLLVVQASNSEIGQLFFTKIDDEWNITGEYRDGSITSDKLDMHIYII